MSKSKDSAAPAAILDYLNKQNRPYSAIDIFNNLHKEYGKTAVVRVLEQLAANKKLVEKTYGKQKIYYANQLQFAECNDNELRSMDTEINNLGEKVKEIQQQIKSSEIELSGLSSSLTSAELKSKISTVKQENEKLEIKLKSLTSAENVVSTEEKDKIYQTRDKYVKEWRKRKRITNDILNAILEGYPKPKKMLFEEVGIETDEDVNISMPK